MVNEMKRFTRAEVENHNNNKSTWIIIENNVYDVTKFLQEHPGGEEVLLEQAGKDGTEAFLDAGHSSEAREMMEKYKLGELVDAEKTPKSPKFRPKSCIKSFVKSNIIPVAPYATVAVVMIGAFIAYRIYRSTN